MKEGAERIIKRVLDEAQHEATRIVTDAEKTAESMILAAKNKASAKKEHILEQAQKDAEEQKKRIIGVAELEARKEILGAKKELIGQSFGEALRQLGDMDEQAYLNFIKDLLLGLTETGTEKVAFSARDLKRIPDTFWQEVNEALVSAGKKGGLKPADEPADIKGGFILSSKEVEVNCSFEALLNIQRDELEPEIAAVLFK